ncbi:MAG: ArsR/SmtB family transcription factor [Acutalibacteraceae bacterium]
MDERRTAEIFKAFCDENRIKIIKLLCSGEKCACKLLEKIDVTQPTLSHHMKILCDSGVVVGRKEGKWMHYSISEKGVKQAKECLRQLTTLDVEYENKPCCEKQ